ncbi:MAG: FHA domain-containing protein [Acidobacteria bacterium]|nr:MAG: FHA domain-containing protein [Acidobacteriota bacterium]REJ98959.1 MAG: FHA domain-containing protein [Acidobacteriota bacterium]REK16321.1 MAG: FHA domain-containing protein [Acidobacteriota bacterium]REK44002.1 MAG: FHA domain-containing protein [Acidobacteriota bacterium]
MFDLVLIYSGDEGAVEIPVEGGRFAFGRGSDADRRFEDSGLSRLHATVYREGDQVWIVDENSSNGTFVNGQRVEAGGTPLEDGDTIKIGNETNIRVEFREQADQPVIPAESESQTVSSGPAADEEGGPSLLPYALLLGAILVIGGSVLAIGLMATAGGGSKVTASDRRSDEDPFADLISNDEDDKNENGTAGDRGDSNPGNTSSESTTTDTQPGLPVGPIGPPISGPGGKTSGLPAGKTYQQLTPEEQIKYVEAKSEIVSKVIGNSSGVEIPSAATAKIKQFLDGYVSRIRRSKKDDCGMGTWPSSDMTSVLNRAKENAPFVIRAFNEKGIDPQVGLYLAMIESEHCACLQSPTGPLGMFQFTQATGRRYGLDVRAGASPSNPDERCIKEPAARAAAAYMKSLTGRIGTGPLSVPLAVASYNSGEGGLGKNLKIALESNQSQDRSFWTLVANSDKLAVQFQNENIKYVPKFFAAAIIGENPRDFGVDLEPLSLYTK